MDSESILFDLGFLWSASKNNTYRNSLLQMTNALVNFLNTKELTTVVLTAPDEKSAQDFTIRLSDLTAEGLEVYKVAERRWMPALDRGSKPSDVTILERALNNLRAKSM
jgi:hypothetical protein